MKGILGYSLTAFEVYMQWYIIYDDMRIILGERLANLYAYSISNASNCLLWTIYFRKFIEDAGEDPEAISFTEKEQLLTDFGKAIATNHGKTDQELFDKLSKGGGFRRIPAGISHRCRQVIMVCRSSNFF
jgi:hypothetical protein